MHARTALDFGAHSQRVYNQKWCWKYDPVLTQDPEGLENKDYQRKANRTRVDDF